MNQAVTSSIFKPEKLTVIAGPCSVESESQILQIAHSVKHSGASFLRGGAFKPRTSPHSFQGLKEKGLKLLAKAREETGLPIVTEVLSENDIDLIADYADVLQVGARNSQNFSLLRALGKIRKPILLKRGFGCTIREYILATEYILQGGNEEVILCERGIRTFETATRFTFDINAIPILKSETNLPVIADPSHGTGKANLIEPIAKASVAAGADGLMIEVHHDPKNALSDADQSIDIQAFSTLMDRLRPLASVVGKSLQDD